MSSQSHDPTPGSDGLVFLPIHTGKERFTAFSVTPHPTVRSYLVPKHTLRYIQLAMAPFLGKRKTEARIPQTFILLTHFVHNYALSSFFLLPCFPCCDSHLACFCVVSSSFFLCRECWVFFFSSLSLLRQLFPINPHLFSLSCSVILSFLFHNALSAFLLSIWATWSSPFLE